MDIVFVTNNLNKLSEIKNLVSSQYKVLSLKDIGFHEEIEETEITLEGNASLKARHIYNKYKCNCFADDTGLEIDALNGKPGVYSARYAGPACNATDNINKVLRDLDNTENRQAMFVTVIALIIEGKEYIFKGQCEGTITKKFYGNEGFGYDPIFLPVDSKLTFAEMNQIDKGKISHRGIAVRKLISFLEKKQL